MHVELGFWLAVGLVSIVTLALFKLLAAKVPVPALQKLAAFV
jgi:hypothetical protein